MFDAIHRGNADPKLLSYEYLKILPQIADSQSSKLWIVPTELTAALDAVTKGFTGRGGDEPVTVNFEGLDEDIADSLASTSLQDVDEALASARGEATRASSEAEESGTHSGKPFDPRAELGQHPDMPEQRGE